VAPTARRSAGGGAEEDAAAQQQQQQQQQPQQNGSPAVPPQQSIKDYFKWRPLPWWFCCFVGIFLLTKLQLVYNDSPCAVLGTQSPVNMSDIKRAFRTLSMCTHPDRLRGRLKRPPTQAEERRGEIIFNRASAAKDELTRVLKHGRKKEVACYEGELEMALLQFFTQVTKALGSLGVNDYLGLAWDLAWNLMTFEAGFFNTLLSVLWLAFVFRLLKQFLMYLWRLGVIRGSVALVTTVIIGPLPTLLHFVALPVVRLWVFCQSVLKGFRPEVETNAVAAAAAPVAEATGTAGGDDSTRPEAATASTANRAAAQEGTNRALLRRRGKRETDEEKEKKNKELLAGSAEARGSGGGAGGGGAAGAADPTHGAGPMPEGIFKCVAWSHREPVKARQAAATAVQFDLLLILTKPVIPLFMLIALGQVWNGLFSSLFIGHALRRWVPQMSYEAHHLLCSFFGVVHTLLGVSAQQVEDYANREGKKVLHLAWTWSFKDVLSVIHMCQLGSTVTAMSALGNEPSFAASFAAGIALRMAIAQDSIRGLNFFKGSARWLEASLKDLGVSLDAAEEVVAYSGDGIGDCGGGPFRMLFGDGPQARFAALALKVWLMLIPLLAAMQWFQRTVHAARMLGKRWKMTRFVQRLVLFVVSLIQCCLIARVELNASNGALGNFWIAMLFGCVGESLLSTYDIRGPVRQIFFLLLFLFI